MVQFSFIRERVGGDEEAEEPVNQLFSLLIE